MFQWAFLTNKDYPQFHCHVSCVQIKHKNSQNVFSPGKRRRLEVVLKFRKFQPVFLFTKWKAPMDSFQFGDNVSASALGAFILTVVTPSGFVRQLGLVKFTFGSERVKLPCSIFLHNAPCRAFGGRHLQPRQRLNSSRGNFSEFVLVFRKNKTSMELYLDQSSVDISGISQQFVCCDFWPSQLWETYEILYRFLLVKLNSFDMLSLGMSMCFNPILFDERPFQLWTSGGGGGGRG